MSDHITITVIVHDPLIGDAVEKVATFDRNDLRKDPRTAIEWVKGVSAGSINTILYGPQQ